MRQLRANPETADILSVNDPADGDRRNQHWLELLEKIGKGDQTALACLYQETSALLFGLILRIVAHRPLAEEILLEVYKQIYQQSGADAAQRSAPLTWMLRIARSRALACLRAATVAGEFQPEVFVDLGPGEFHLEPEDAALFSRQRKLARAALEALPWRQREIIELAYFGGMTVAKIASRLELSTDAVHKQIRLAMMRLRELLRPVPQDQL